MPSRVVARLSLFLLPVLGDLAIQGDYVTDLDLVTDGVAKHEEALAGGRVLIGLGRAQEDTVCANGRDEALDAGNGLALEGRQESVPVDLGNGDGRGHASRGEKGRDGLHGGADKLLLLLLLDSGSTRN